MSDMDLKELSRPFDTDDLEWRIQQSGISNGKPWGMAIAYVTNRAIQGRLDDVVGPGLWKNEFQPEGNGYLCGLSIKVEGEWVTKWDGSEKTDIEPMKGGLSGSMKRAAVQWGIGRYLYNLETVFVICNEVSSRRDAPDNYAWFKNKHNDTKMQVNWETPNVPMWALPGVNSEEYLKAITDSEDLHSLKESYQAAYRYAKSFGMDEMVKQYTEEKDRVKQGFDELAKTKIAENLLEVSEWLDKQLDTLKLIPNNPSVEQVNITWKRQLTEKCDGQYFDKDVLFNKLAEAIKLRMDEIGEDDE